MKHEIGITQSSYLIEDWPGKYDVFSWLEYVVTVPNPIFLVTTRKANGAANANLHSWGLLVGERDHYSSLLALLETKIEAGHSLQRYVLPLSDGASIAWLYAHGRVVEQADDELETVISVMLSPADAARFSTRLKRQEKTAQSKSRAAQ